MNERQERLIEILMNELRWSIENKAIDDTQVEYWKVITAHIAQEQHNEQR